MPDVSNAKFYRNKIILPALILPVLMITMISGMEKTAVYQATGIKIGEVTDSSVIIWTRLTASGERISDEAPVPRFEYYDPESETWITKIKGRPDMIPKVIFPEDCDIGSLAGSAPGCAGRVRVGYRPEGVTNWHYTEWAAVDAQRDYTHQFRLYGLQSGTTYLLLAEAENGPTVEGQFRTAPKMDVPAKILFTVSTGQAYGDRDTLSGFKIYPEMLKLDPDFFVHTGDIVYYDYWAKSLPLARWGWARMYSLPTNVFFHRQVASYFIKDDHDTWMDDCWPGMQTKFMGEFTLAQGQQVFREQVPMGEKTFRTIRWGRDLQIWLMEGRDFRSPNDLTDGPDKSIWGKEQKEWFRNSVLASDASYKILISPTPVVGPDRPKKNDNHSNRGFAHEGKEIRQFVAGLKNMVVICGDRHWQYVSVDEETGVREYSCGPASDKHAGGWDPGDVRAEHRYLNVTGGFLAAMVNRDENGKPLLTLRHYSVTGKILNEDVLRIE